MFGFGKKLRKGPNCDMCGEHTYKPHLYETPRTHWRCAPCQKVATLYALGCAEEAIAEMREHFAAVRTRREVS